VARIVLQPGNPLDLTSEDLMPLVHGLERLGSEGQEVIITERPTRGYGVTWWQVLLIYVGMKAGDALINSVVSSAVDWAKNHLSEGGRPHYIGIYGPDGEIIRAVEVDAGGEESDVTERERGVNRPAPPELMEG
jgi:hypothetical protein